MATYEQIPGYEGLYRISSNGEIYSIISGRIKPGETLKNGYKRITLFKDGVGKHYFIHRLVAQTFISNPNNKLQVNHKDGNKQNNSVSNLEWVDASENMKHAYVNKLIHPKTRRVIQYTKDYVPVKEWDSIVAACNELGINHANIITVCNQNTNRKYAGGYIWRYA